MRIAVTNGLTDDEVVEAITPSLLHRLAQRDDRAISVAKELVGDTSVA